MSLADEKTDIDDPDTLLEIACKIEPGVVKSPIDIPVVEAMRFVLERLRSANANARPEVKKAIAAIAVAERKALGLYLEMHESAPQTVCAGWEGPCPDMKSVPRYATLPFKVRDRKGEPWRCNRCSVKRTWASRTPEERSEFAKKVQNNRPKEERIASAKKTASKMTKEQKAARTIAVIAANMKRSKSDRIKSAGTVDWVEARSKAWATRRAKKPTSSQGQ